MLETDSKASSQFVKKALVHEDIVLKSKGDQFFSYTYVADAVSALLYILLHGENGQAYNISSDYCNVKLADFAKQCANIAGTKITFDLPTESEKNGYSIATKAILDNTKLKSIGWDSMYKFEEAIKNTIIILS